MFRMLSCLGLVGALCCAALAQSNSGFTTGSSDVKGVNQSGQAVTNQSNNQWTKPGNQGFQQGNQAFQQGNSAGQPSLPAGQPGVPPAKPGDPKR